MVFVIIVYDMICCILYYMLYCCINMMYVYIYIYMFEASSLLKAPEAASSSNASAD